MKKRLLAFAKRWLFTLVIITVLLFALLRFPALRHDFMESAARIPLWSVALLIGIQIITQLLLNLQWRQIAASGKVRITFRDMFYINSQAEVVHTVPGGHVGSEITRFVQFSRMGGCTGTRAAAVVAAQKLFSLSALFFICLFATAAIIGHVEWLRTLYLQITVYGTLLAFLLVSASVFIMPNQMKAYLEKQNEPRFSWTLKVRKFLTTLLDQVISIRKNSKIWVSFLLLAVVIWLIYPLKMYLLAVQFVPDAGFFYLAAISFVAYMVALIPIFPGGLGGFEVTMTGLLVSVTKFELGDAIALTVVFRFITFWFVLMISLMFIGFYKFRYPTLKGC